jgi:hypothetical protein
VAGQSPLENWTVSVLAVCGSAEELIASDDVDAVLVASPGLTHKKFVLASIAAGKPVFCEKPLATTQAACERILAAEMSSGRKLIQVGYMRRYDAATLPAICLIRSCCCLRPRAVCWPRSRSVSASATGMTSAARSSVRGERPNWVTAALSWCARTVSDAAGPRQTGASVSRTRTTLSFPSGSVRSVLARRLVQAPGTATRSAW